MPVQEKSLMPVLAASGDFAPIAADGKDNLDDGDFAAQLGAALIMSQLGSAVAGTSSDRDRRGAIESVQSEDRDRAGSAGDSKSRSRPSMLLAVTTDLPAAFASVIANFAPPPPGDPNASTALRGSTTSAPVSHRDPSAIAIIARDSGPGLVASNTVALAVDPFGAASAKQDSTSSIYESKAEPAPNAVSGPVAGTKTSPSPSTTRNSIEPEGAAFQQKLQVTFDVPTASDRAAHPVPSKLVELSRTAGAKGDGEGSEVREALPDPGPVRGFTYSANSASKPIEHIDSEVRPIADPRPPADSVNATSAPAGGPKTSTVPTDFGRSVIIQAADTADPSTVADRDPAHDPQALSSSTTPMMASSRFERAATETDSGVLRAQPFETHYDKTIAEIDEGLQGPRDSSAATTSGILDARETKAAALPGAAASTAFNDTTPSGPGLGTPTEHISPLDQSELLAPEQLTESVSAVPAQAALGQDSGARIAQGSPDNASVREIAKTVDPGRPEHDPVLTTYKGANTNSISNSMPSTASEQPDAKVVVTPRGIANDRAAEISLPRVANLKVDLDGGGSAQATIRERAGTVDLKITTPSADSARHLASEIATLRRSLDEAGLRLRSAEIAHRSDGQEAAPRDPDRDRRQETRPNSLQVFTLKEVNNG